MDKDILLNMDPYMALSIINMKLRDEFNSLEDFSSYYNMKREDIEEKLKVIEYHYDIVSNSFVAFS
ncbi:DUF4250 domain-containing protein [Clostridium sp.]|uniref:DUF4250 domain-containing protein n=1 Tax=Clostridium sp. TaxID=1506 RepID=UPI002FCC2CA6